MKAQGAQAVFVLPDLMLAHEAKHIADLALLSACPCGLGWLVYGGWRSHGILSRLLRMSRRLAVYVDRVLKGTKPGDSH